MAEEKKSPKVEIEMLCKSLLRLTNEMIQTREILTTYMNRHSIYLIVYLLGVITMFVFKKYIWFAVIFLLFSLSFFVISFMYTERLQKLYINQYRIKHRDAVGIVSRIIKIVDWGELRKQQYYKGTSEKVSDAIRLYYDETQMAMSPGRYGREYCTIFLLCQIITRYACLIFSILIFILSLKSY